LKTLQFHIALAACLWNSVLGAQNLIPNPGFEDYSALPTSISQWNYCNLWNNCSSAIASPDYFHYDGSLGGDLPETPLALVEAHNGDGIMGFAATGVRYTDFREYISVKLDAPLVIGAKYNLSFWFTNGEINEFSNAGLGASGFGAYFSELDPLQIANQPIMVEPQVKMNTMLYNREWVQISFNFFADCAAEHITIGVFGDDDDKNIVAVEGQNPVIAYYFMDDFELVEIIDETPDYNGEHDRPVDQEVNEITEAREPKPSKNENPVTQLEEAYFIPNAFTPDGDGINDVFRPVFPETYAYAICIFDRWGKQIYWGQGQGSYWDGYVDGKRVPQGVYLWKITYQENISSSNQQILEGSITVLH
jgi:gliding motility-associated-like protein